MKELVCKGGDHSHVAVCPSAGIAHLVPFLRLASMLASSGCRVTLITIRPTLSKAEDEEIASFLLSHPQICSFNIDIDSKLPNCNTSANDNANASTTGAPSDGPDPFFVRYMTVSRSAPLLTTHLSTLSPQPSAVFSDIMFASGFNQALAELGIPNYVLIGTSARFFSLASYLPELARSSNGTTTATPSNADSSSPDEELINFPPGLPPIPKSSVPPPFFNPNHIFTKLITTNQSCVHLAKGIVFNTFDYLEPVTLSALLERRILPELPPLYTIGPLRPLKRVRGDTDDSTTTYAAWLDEQPAGSVVYVSFGSRTAMSREQIKELGAGLEGSGARFLWVLKTTIIDKQEEDDIGDILGEELMLKTKERGLVVRGWVDQEAILAHPAVGGFVTHSGWNSMVEAAQQGMPVLAWPQLGDQKVNAEALTRAGLGLWASEWGWIGERLVKGDEIAEKIKELMTSEKVRESARRVGDEATKAWDSENGGGSSYKMWTKMLSDMMSGN